MKTILKLLLCISVLVMGATLNVHADDDNICEVYYTTGMSCSGTASDMGDYSGAASATSTLYISSCSKVTGGAVQCVCEGSVTEATACSSGLGPTTTVISGYRNVCTSNTSTGNLTARTCQGVSSCSSGQYLENGSCHPCTSVSYVQSENITNGTRTRTCYRTGGAGGSNGSDACTGANCLPWVYSCDTGYILSGTSCVYNGGGSCSDGQYWNGSSCANCIPPPSNSSYTGSGTTATDCPWQCNSGYVQSGNSCISGGGGGATCNTVTCSTKVDCLNAGYGSCSSGCCSGTKPANCTNYGVCSSNSECASGTCSSNCCTAPSTNTCTSNLDCMGVQVCSNGTCVTPAIGGGGCGLMATCSSNSNCPGNQTCNTTTGCCQAGSGGTSCSTDAQCNKSANYPICHNGTCVAASFPICSSTTSCTNHLTCKNFSGFIGGVGSCVNGFCYAATGNWSPTYNNSQGACQLRCPSGVCEYDSTWGSWYCVPNCATGEYFDNASEICSCISCGLWVANIYSDSNMTTLASASTGSSSGGHDPVSSCRIAAGTYYDDKGTFEYSSDCFYSD